MNESTPGYTKQPKRGVCNGERFSTYEQSYDYDDTLTQQVSYVREMLPRGCQGA